MYKKIATLFINFCLLSFALASNGTGKIFGNVKEKESEAPVSKATIYVVETKQIVNTDNLGGFSLELNPGVYTLKSFSKGYDTTTITVTVTAEKVEFIDLYMPKHAEQMDAVNITVKANKNTELAVLDIQKRSLNVSDGLSSEALKKAGDQDVAAAVTRVPGLSVEGGKYVFVRGLSDRYTKTQLNYMDLPGIDPDKNTVQLDIFPTNLIDNIFVTKTFSADMVGDFTGGLVNIITKDFPINTTTAYNISLGYNPNMQFNTGYQMYKGSALDAFTLGANNYKLPVDPLVKSPITIGGNKELETLTKAFSPVMGAQAANNMLNTSIGFSHGNQIKKSENRIFGYNTAINFSNNYLYFDEIILNSFRKNRDKNNYEMQEMVNQKGRRSEFEAATSALLNGSYKTKKAKLTATLFHTRNTNKQAAFYNYVSSEIGQNAGQQIAKNILYYNQRNVTSLNINGNYQLSDNKKINWIVNPSFSKNLEPDMRQTFFALEDNNKITLNQGNGAGISRIWRSLVEYNVNSRADVELKNNFFKKTNTTKYGLYGSLKSRDFSIYRFEFRDLAPSNYSGNPNDLFTNQYLYSAESGKAEGIVAQNASSPSNNYQASMAIAAAYIQNETQVSPKLRAIYGLRVESANMFYTGVNQSGQAYSNENVLSTVSPLPSIALIFSPIKDVNYRFNISRTVARPSFKEKSLAQIYDPITDRTFIGNLDVKQTDISNLDLRWEKFGKEGQLISVSAFGKHFQNPIEVVAYKPESPDNFQARNVSQGAVAGLEFELRRIVKPLSGLNYRTFFATNLSYMVSTVKMNPDEYLGRTQQARTGQTIKDTRAMQGQSPYLVNANINFQNKKGWQTTLSYNVQGPRLAIVGMADNPDVYEKEFHSLDFNAQRTLDKDKKWNIGIRATNILGSKRIMYQSSYKAQDQIFQQFKPYTGFIFSLRYAL